VRALVLDSNGALSLRDRPKPEAGDECLIRVTAAGICGTDLELFRGYAGFSGVPGHEFVGVVEASGAGGTHWIGKRIAGEITVGCGECAGCRAAGRGHCDVRTVVGIRDRDGAFAEYLRLPARNLHALPDSLDDESAVFVEPVAAACRIAEQVKIDRDTRAAVVGAGRLGLLIAQVLREHGAEVRIVVRGEPGRSLATKLGFDTVDVDSTARLARQCDLVVDATGAAAGFATASALVRPRGTLVVKSTIHGETPIAMSPLVVDEITVVGSRCGPFDRAIELLAAGRLDVKALVGGIYPLERFAEAFEQAKRGGKAIFNLRYGFAPQDSRTIRSQ
jgi:threonine dehydrogenase-like Zn-dependent dehydrogenase